MAKFSAEDVRSEFLRVHDIKICTVVSPVYDLLVLVRL